MPSLKDQIKSLLKSLPYFTKYAGSLALRNYQVDPAAAIIDSVIHRKGLSFVVIFPRQSGKNELQAQIQTYLLTIFSKLDVAIVAVSPTWKPQSYNAMARLERVLKHNLITRDLWDKQRDYIYSVGQARCIFLSGSPTANIVGATADLLLSVDEAQDILPEKFDKDIAPMAASTNATRIFWGTAWTSNTLLAREEAAARALEDQDGIQRVFKLTCDQVAQEVPPYGSFVAEQVAKLGRHHPMVKTQYYSEVIDAEGGLFPPARLAHLYGIHPPQVRPDRTRLYALTLDVAGEDENGQDLNASANSARDASVITIAEVDLTTQADPLIALPTYRVVFRQSWTGIKHADIYGQILSMAEIWGVRYLVCDATGVGAGLTAFLAKRLGPKVIPFIFNSKTKSDLGWAFLAMVDSGRLKDYAVPETDFQTWGQAHALQQTYFKQLEFTQYEIQPGPDKKIRWSVPDGTRDPASGQLLHDDLVISAAMFSLLDQVPWSVSGPAQVVKAADPLDDMKGF